MLIVAVSCCAVRFHSTLKMSLMMMMMIMMMILLDVSQIITANVHHRRSTNRHLVEG